MLEIIMLIWGGWTLISGSYMGVKGAPARICGLILLAPIPLTIWLGPGIVKEFHIKNPFFIEGGFVFGCWWISQWVAKMYLPNKSIVHPSPPVQSYEQREWTSTKDSHKFNASYVKEVDGGIIVRRTEDNALVIMHREKMAPADITYLGNVIALGLKESESVPTKGEASSLTNSMDIGSVEPSHQLPVVPDIREPSHSPYPMAYTPIQPHILWIGFIALMCGVAIIVLNMTFLSPSVTYYLLWIAGVALFVYGALAVCR